MAESNAAQVILTDDGIKIIKAQNTADNAAGGVANLNDPNLMSVIEKQNNIGQFAGLTSQYNVIVQNAKDEGIDTTAVTTAYNNLNQFMAGILADPDHASDIDRATYKTYQDAYNKELSKLQNALQNNANNKFTSAASAAKQAASTASQAFSQAQSAVNYANSEMAVQSTATAKAQSAADSAFSQAKTAIDNGKVTGQAVTDLKDGSKLTIAELGNGLATKVANSDYASYKDQTASQIGQLVTDGAFSAYQQTTKDLISSKVATSDFSSYKEETAKSIGNMVKSKDFETYEKQTADAFLRTVSTADFNNLTISNRNLALGTATPFKINGNGSTNNVGRMYSTSGTISKGTTITVTFDISSTSSTGTYIIQFINGTWETVTNVDGVDNFAGSPVVSGTQHHSYTFVTTADFSDGFQLRLDNTTGIVTVSNFIVSESSKEVSWTPAPEDQATQSQFTQLSGDIDLRVKKGELIDQINIQAGNTLISSSGQLTLSGKTINFDTVNPVIIPSANIDTLLVGKKLEAANISANTFTTNNGTFEVDSNGGITANNMTLIGGTLTSPTINASTINGSTINGTTFNAGDIISSTYNTSRFYPTTITPDGLVSTTGFNSMDGLRTEMSAGSFVTKYRAVNSSSNQYEAYDGVFSGDELALNSGFTNGIDMGFKQSVSGNQLTGQVVLSPLNGIHLWGSTQAIHFSGLQMNGTGITFNSYGNIIADPASTWWRIVDFSGNGIANFGTDTAGSNAIQFNRELDIGNFQINTGHTFTSADGDAIHFAKGRGGAAEIYAGDVHYTSLVKSSLLSVKRDVQKADIAYWAQLVNSIDLATYQYKTDDNTSHIRLSSIVDDVNDTKQWKLPDVFISRDENGKLSGVDDSVLLNATLATVQEQQKEIDQLNGHNMELEARLNKLEAKLNG
ncbi:phage tail protein [Lactiplantibacillus plantarum]|nr:phage tail protein [Lactiplantibacillus plantarum]